MDYSKAVGQEVISHDGRNGRITKVDESNIYIEMENHGFGSGGYLYDPFLHEDFRFADSEWQNKVDEAIGKIDQEAVKLIEKNTVNDPAEEVYRITKDNEDGTRETVFRLKGTRQEAFYVFGHVITEQGRVFRRGGIKWRVVRLFDAKTGEQLAQES